MLSRLGSTLASPASRGVRFYASSPAPGSSSATRSTVPPRSTHATYHPGGYGVSEGLKRARAPYRIRNAVTGSLILGFVTAVYLYSISKVKQDDFSDLADVRATNTDTEPETNAAPAHGHKV